MKKGKQGSNKKPSRAAGKKMGSKITSSEGNETQEKTGGLLTPLEEDCAARYLAQKFVQKHGGDAGDSTEHKSFFSDGHAIHKRGNNNTTNNSLLKLTSEEYQKIGGLVQLFAEHVQKEFDYEDNVRLSKKNGGSWGHLPVPQAVSQPQGFFQTDQAMRQAIGQQVYQAGQLGYQAGVGMYNNMTRPQGFLETNQAMQQAIGQKVYQAGVGAYNWLYPTPTTLINGPMHGPLNQSWNAAVAAVLPVSANPFASRTWYERAYDATKAAFSYVAGMFSSVMEPLVGLLSSGTFLAFLGVTVTAGLIAYYLRYTASSEASEQRKKINLQKRLDDMGTSVNSLYGLVVVSDQLKNEPSVITFFNDIANLFIQIRTAIQGVPDESEPAGAAEMLAKLITASTQLKAFEQQLANRAKEILTAPPVIMPQQYVPAVYPQNPMQYPPNPQTLQSQYNYMPPQMMIPSAPPQQYVFPQQQQQMMIPSAPPQQYVFPQQQMTYVDPQLLGRQGAGSYINPTHPHN